MSKAGRERKSGSFALIDGSVDTAKTINRDESRSKVVCAKFRIHRPSPLAVGISPTIARATKLEDEAITDQRTRADVRHADSLIDD